MKTIWKFPLVIDAVQTIEMPAGAEILSVLEQDGRICVWALVTPGAAPLSRRFEMFWTGDAVPNFARRRFLATVQIGRHIHHVFELL